MNQDSPHYVYSQEVIDFLTVAVQICALLERFPEEDKKEAVNQLTCLLPMLYLKARMLSRPNEELEGYIEQFCTEATYDAIRSNIAATLGSDDSYLELPVEEGRYSDLPVTCFISEQLADLYQELADLAGNFRTQETSVMNDAVLACLDAMDLHWGQKLLSVLHALDVLRLDPNFAPSED